MRVRVIGAVALLAALVACAPAPSRTIEVAKERQRTNRPGLTAGVMAPNRSAGCATTARPPASSVRWTTWDGQGRWALLTIPESYRPGTPAPLLVSLHPFTFDPFAWEAYSGLAAAAASRGYVVVSPRGSDPGPRWSVPGGLPLGVDDLGYVDDLVNGLTDELCIDQNRIFAAGFSAGAAMAVALGCTLPDRFTAIAASGGGNLTDLCPSRPPVDTMILHGTADPIAPPAGSYVIFAPPLGLDIADVVATSAARAGCDPTPVTTQVAPTVEVDRYQRCTARVEYWRELGAGHTWAGAATNILLEAILGPTNTDISANRVVLDFFDTARA